MKVLTRQRILEVIESTFQVKMRHQIHLQSQSRLLLREEHLLVAVPRLDLLDSLSMLKCKIHLMQLLVNNNRLSQNNKLNLVS